jgi:PhoPQ-activated pathogenicity-related protein
MTRLSIAALLAILAGMMQGCSDDSSEAVPASPEAVPGSPEARPGSAAATPDSSAAALADYVARPDPSFSWHLRARYEAGGTEIAELILQSQTWKDIAWKHQLFLIRPPSVTAGAEQGLLVIGGGRWRDDYENEPVEPLPEGSEVFIEMARQLGTIVAVVGQVPFQPMFGLSEDNLIAYTFDQYLASGDTDWPLLLPMVKSAVRAMDTAQAFAEDEWDTELSRFTVLGGSKRGWTTWLTGAVDPRAATLVPVVIDALNFAAHMPYQTEVWGAPSEALEPYTERGLIDVMGGPAGAELRAIVDPYSYRERFTQPKLIVVATNDEYFPLDAMNLYWDGLPAPKYALYLPNQSHSSDDFARLIPALDAIHRDGAALPDLEWEFERQDDGLRLCIRSEPAPVTVSAWTAESADRDFRDETFVSESVVPADGLFIIDVAPPPAGYSAVFAEAVFAGEDGVPFPLSTNVRVIDSAGQAASAATAINGVQGVCP